MEEDKNIEQTEVKKEGQPEEVKALKDLSGSSLQIGDIILNGNEPINYMANLVLFLLKDKDVREYLELKKKEKALRGGGYFG